MIVAVSKSHLTLSFFVPGRIPEEQFHNKLVWAPLRPADSQIQLKHDANIPQTLPTTLRETLAFKVNCV